MSLAERVGRRVCFIHNPAAGRGAARDLADSLTRHARERGWSSAVRTTARAGDEVGLATAAARDGWRLVVAVGGDGTIHGVANGVLAAGGDTIVGVVPVGTGNDFAFMAGLAPGAIAANLTRLFSGRVRRFDVGRALNEYFVNSMGVGFDAEVVRQLERLNLRGFTLYLAAVYKTFWGFVPPWLAVAAAEHGEDGRFMMLEIAIGRRAGGGFRLTPNAEPDDGLFDVCVIRRVGLFQFLRYVPRVIRGTHGSLPPVTLFRSRRVSVRANPDPVPVHMDGELRLPTRAEITAEIDPGRLEVLCVS